MTKTTDQGKNDERCGEVSSSNALVMCQNCGKNPAADPHSCPCAEKVIGNDDPEFCTCCQDCTLECGLDI